MKMNKKVLSMFVISVLALGLGTALLVPYLSNTITGTVNIDTPLTLSGTLDGNTESFLGGETLLKTIILTNNADATIVTHSEIVIIAPSNWESDLSEFNKLELKDLTNSFDCGDISNTCTIDSNNGRVLNCVLGDATLLPNSEIEYQLTAEFNQAIEPGEYSFSVQAMD